MKECPAVRDGNREVLIFFLIFLTYCNKYITERFIIEMPDSGE